MKGFVFLSLLLTLSAFADESLIRSVRELRDSLPLRDPQRMDLTLRLADLTFDESLEFSKLPQPTSVEEKKLLRLRQESLSLYESVLRGDQGMPAPGGLSRTKIEFQIARLCLELGQTDRARGLLEGVLESEAPGVLKREAALRLAEMAESNPQQLDRSEKYFRLALANCMGTDLCSYAHYRLAWVQRNRGQMAPAIDEMHQALWDSRGQIREEALRDLMLFYAQVPGDGAQATMKIEEIAGKIARPTILKDLADSYFAAGNKAAGIQALERAQVSKKDFVNAVRLAEETYGIRDWDRLRSHLAAMDSFPAPYAGEGKVEAEKMLRRLTIQLDGERQSQKDLVDDFQAAAMAYLKFFPQSPERMKVIEGWIASESDATKKMSQIQAWNESSALALKRDEQTRLREMRVSIAQKAGRQDIVSVESATLAGVTKDPAKAREYRYLEARSLYEAKKTEEALPLFRELARLRGPKFEADTWAIQSQNLALDIYNQRKDFDGLIAQAQTWLKQPTLAQQPKLRAELEDMQKSVDQARFERAASLGKSPAALAEFMAFCREGKFGAKACENARVLSIQLNQQDELHQVLKVQGKDEELAAELEASGHFAEAAALYEKLGKHTDLLGQLKLALLYELGAQTKDQVRILRGLMNGRLKASSFEKEEALVQTTLEDADLMGPEALSLHWSKDRALAFAERLEAQGKGSRQTRDLITASTQETGPAWARMVLSGLDALEAKEKAISFYGRTSKRDFSRRLKALEALQAYAKRYLDGAGAGTRVTILTTLKEATRRLHDEILASPMPSELGPEQIAAVQKALQDMAAPFQVQSEQYAKLLESQKGALTDRVVTSAAVPVRVKEGTSAEKDDAIRALKRNPADESALRRLRDYYRERGDMRLSAYFEGRIQQLKNEESRR